ncbi:MAG: DUF1425 domain-containing protein [Pedobacter sp.]|nr:DUF1425 domain-containing protein [Pedobacter sp.]
MKRLFTTTITATLLGSALLLSACSSSPKLINYRGGDLKGVIEVKRSAVENTEGGLPQAKAILFNDAGTTTKFEYKFVWFDANDMPIDDNDRPWKPASLQGKDEMTVNGTGPNDRAKKFQLQVREPQGVTK